ncbi:MAG: hypothetical protein JOY78_14395 [Pseudonocardia sp.]|nr:hypothetical protein [Pseudonocardia sp.]
MSWLEHTLDGSRLGLRLFELGASVPGRRDLRDVALPYMQDLYETTHETINLAALEGLEIVYLEKIAGHRRRAATTSSPGQHIGITPTSS